MLSAAAAVLPVRGGGSRLTRKSFDNLYQRSTIRFGNKTGPNKHKVKVKRTWKPNVHPHRLWSEVLQRDFRIHVSTRALKTIDQKGGLDAYILSMKPHSLGPGFAQDLRERMIATIRTGVDPLKEKYTAYEAAHDLAIKDYVARRDLAVEAQIRNEDQQLLLALTGPWKKYGGEHREAYMKARNNHDNRGEMAQKLIQLKQEMKDLEDEGRIMFNKMSLEDRGAMLDELQVLDEITLDRGSEADEMLAEDAMAKELAKRPEYQVRPLECHPTPGLPVPSVADMKGPLHKTNNMPKQNKKN